MGCCRPTFHQCWSFFVGFGFVAGALIASGLGGGKAGVVRLLRRLLIWPVAWSWYAVAILGPAAFYLLGIGIHVLLGGTMPDFRQPFIVRLVPPSLGIALAGSVFFLYQVLFNGEEFGWRGYALPELQVRRSALVASVIIGAVWSFWHLPKFLNSGDPHDTSFWFFAVNMIANAVLCTWLFNKTRGSLLLMLLLHAGVNTGIVMLPIMPAVIGETRPRVIAYLLQNVAALAVVIFAGVKPRPTCVSYMNISWRITASSHRSTSDSQALGDYSALISLRTATQLSERLSFYGTSLRRCKPVVTPGRPCGENIRSETLMVGAKIRCNENQKKSAMKLGSRSLSAFLIACFAMSGTASAHHSFAAFYDVSKVTEVDGELTRVLWNNPHVRFTVRAKDNNGREEMWDVETNSVSILGRMGLSADSLKIGSRIKVAGNPARGSQRGMLAGNVLLPTGQEIVLNPGEKPRWSNRTVGTSGPWLATAGKASDPQRGIFRVWSSALTGPWLFPENAKYPLTARAQARVAAFDPVKNYPLRDCTPKGMPTIMEQPYPIQFTQQGENIRLRLEEYDTLRTIHMKADSASQQRSRSPLGYSVGRWDGTALIVTTTSINWPHFDAAGIPISERVEIVERFTPSADGSRLDYRMTVTDPLTFTQPVLLQKHWLALPDVEVKPYKCTRS